MDNICSVKTDQIEGKIQIIMRQTNYTEEQARYKLGKFNFNEISVIQDYFGINQKKDKSPEVKSVNQAIYKQIRGHLDGAMRDYRERLDKGENKKVI